MNGSGFNLLNVIISIVVGWCFVSFLQAAGGAISSGDWSNLIQHFKQIVSFKDGKGVVINLIIMAVSGVVAITIWVLATRAK